MWARTCAEAIDRFEPGYQLACGSQPKWLLSRSTRASAQEEQSGGHSPKHVAIPRPSFLEAWGAGKQKGRFLHFRQLK